MRVLVLVDCFRLPQATEEEGAELEELGSFFGAYGNPIPQYRDVVAFVDFRSIL